MRTTIKKKPVLSLPSVAIESGPALIIQPPVLPAKDDTFLAQRYELKYRITELQAQLIREYIKPIVPLDKYSAIAPKHSYDISSLYLDSSVLTLFSETIEGKCNRFKLRARGYDDNPDSPIFFEVKRRLNRVIVKSRFKAQKKDLKPFLMDNITPPSQPGQDDKDLHQFLTYCRLMKAKPITLVKYKREAYETTAKNRVRITFDRELCCQQMSEPVIKVNGPGWKPVKINFVILEIKFTSNYPSWLSNMIKMFNLNVSSMSKYCSSVKTIPGYHWTTE